MSSYVDFDVCLVAVDEVYEALRSVKERAAQGRSPYIVLASANAFMRTRIIKPNS